MSDRQGRGHEDKPLRRRADRGASDPRLFYFRALLDSGRFFGGGNAPLAMAQQKK